ncbi:MAG: class I SAM-dependent RNA methyltransferase [bacterium]|nr:class I SAM-dependent RNA methyltransferase [bacterium]
MTTRLKIDRLIGGGRGLTHHEGCPWMVSGALPGETVDVTTGRRKGKVQFAATQRVVSEPHTLREEDACPHSDTCGGCDWAHVKISSGASLKAEVAAEAARGFPGLAERLRESRVTSSAQRARLRARLHWDPKQRRLGFYSPSSWTVSEISECRVISPTLMDTVPQFEAALTSRCPAPVDVEWLEKLDESSAVFALRPGRNGPKIVEKDWIPDSAQVNNLIIGGFALDSSGNRTIGWGSAKITMDLPFPLTVPIGAFFQGNRFLVRWLFELIEQLVGADPLPTWDLHAGVGLLGAAALHVSNRPLVAVEPFRPAAEAARSNLPSAEVVVGDTAETYLSSVPNLDSEAVVITDPPRAGLSKQLRSQLIAWAPRRIIMLACDPATWARDTAELLANNYELTHLELADLFPSTHHVEVIALLERC